MRFPSGTWFPFCGYFLGMFSLVGRGSLYSVEKYVIINWLIAARWPSQAVINACFVLFSVVFSHTCSRNNGLYWALVLYTISNNQEGYFVGRFWVLPLAREAAFPTDNFYFEMDQLKALDCDKNWCKFLSSMWLFAFWMAGIISENYMYMLNKLVFFLELKFKSKIKWTKHYWTLSSATVHILWEFRSPLPAL